MASATVLLSGGLDSSVLLHYVGKRLQHSPLYALSVYYGQKHERELAMARWQAEAAGVVEHRVLNLEGFQEMIGGSSSLVLGGAEIPALASLDPAARDQPPTYVPNRNMVLLALAAAFAEARKCRLVFYGAQAQDEYGYWDCTSQFIARVNQTLQLNRREAVEIVAPFVNLRKAEEIALGLELGVDFAHTWSCYRGGQRPCGNCPTCTERRQAFEEAAIPDPLSVCK